MKKNFCFFAVVVVCGLALVGCASKPKITDVSGPVEILEHKGTAWGIPQPEWVGEVQGTSNQKTLQKALGIDKHIWIVPKSGRNLDFIKTWADQVDARAEIAASIKQEIADFVGASLTGDRDEVDEKIERFFNEDLFMKLSPSSDESWQWCFNIIENKTIRQSSIIYDYSKDIIKDYTLTDFVSGIKKC